MKEDLGSSETSVLTRATRRNIPEDTILHLCWRCLSSNSDCIKHYLGTKGSRMHLSDVEGYGHGGFLYSLARDSWNCHQRGTASYTVGNWTELVVSISVGKAGSKQEVVMDSRALKALDCFLKQPNTKAWVKENETGAEMSKKLL
jgi:hypothetical protein